MRKDFSIRLRLSAIEGEAVKQMALREGRSQTDVLTRLVRSGLSEHQRATASTQKLVAILRGEAAEQQ
jgi:hypothetical protein